MQCPKCGRGIDGSLFPEGLAFCPYCGQDLKPVSQEAGRLVFCPYCGRELLDQTSFCPHCGKQLKVSEKELSGQKLGKIFLERAVKSAAKAARGVLSSKRKTRKLFQQWSEYAELPPEEIPSMDDLKEMPVERRAKRSLRWYLVVGIVTLIVAGIIVGVILLVN